ncbi:pseudouridine-5'-phosphate glycosidase [Breznakiella homolactica]|uniref:Pseudouridine-5'-phosphate glycosidase n=1 Tax=Breznakiella homolactica TaxID=2798577 RepID=A0A7T7XL39_9SPIR|nr:pseudouridine-5'-phosphate glycosidase [Breznakiella homolactica]QQO08262.1 pseudouridine-5'-phosphate glycosidase [Breznakiella homolactica]
MYDGDIFKEYLDVSPEVQEALGSGMPVVALESTIISHGMPYPKNAETALEVEALIRKTGAVPATIAVLGGRLKAGLSETEIDYLGKTGERVIKSSRRDIPFIVAKGLDGATTVSATMIIADLAGIKIFVTGGIGGVHRFAQESFDISADLQELARTDVAVVCAGPKSILDIPLTLEYLETQGVPVVGYGTGELPAFFTRESGLPVDWRVDTPEELAKALFAKWNLGIHGGILVANPIPEKDSMAKSDIDVVIETALKTAADQGVKGKAITPFLLAHIVELSGGKSLEANINLVKNNARLGAKLAAAYADLVNPVQSV